MSFTKHFTMQILIELSENTTKNCRLYKNMYTFCCVEVKHRNFG